MAEKPKHLISATQFTPTEIREFLAEANSVQVMNSGNFLQHREGVLLFYTPSTRTAGSFTKAIHRLGGDCFQALTPRQSMWGLEREREESGGDVVQQIRSFKNEGYSYVVLRHHQINGAVIASEQSSLPLINAGEGFEGDQSRYLVEHPTQALGDLFTIQQRLGSLSGGLRVAFVGDVRNNPAVNSLAILLATLPEIRLEYITPEHTDLSIELQKHLRDLATNITRRFSVEEVLDANVIYIANSRYSEPPQMIKLTAEHFSKLSRTSLVMHDLLMGHKPDPEIENQSQMIHDLQEQNWVPARMAILKMLLT